MDARMARANAENALGAQTFVPTRVSAAVPVSDQRAKMEFAFRAGEGTDNVRKTSSVAPTSAVTNDVWRSNRKQFDTKSASITTDHPVQL